MSKTLFTTAANVNPRLTAGYTINCNGIHMKVRATHQGVMDLLRMYARQKESK